MRRLRCCRRCRCPSAATSYTTRATPPPYAHPPTPPPPPLHTATALGWWKGMAASSGAAIQAQQRARQFDATPGGACGWARYGQQREGGVQIFTWCRDTAALFNHSTDPNFGGGDGHPGEQGTVSRPSTVSLNAGPQKPLGGAGASARPSPEPLLALARRRPPP
jgi:hypothetical protein